MTSVSCNEHYSTFMDGEMTSALKLEFVFEKASSEPRHDTFDAE